MAIDLRILSKRRQTARGLTVSFMRPTSTSNIRTIDWSAPELTIAYLSWEENLALPKKCESWSMERSLCPCQAAESYNLSVACYYIGASECRQGDKGPLRPGDLEEHSTTLCSSGAFSTAWHNQKWDTLCSPRRDRVARNQSDITVHVYATFFIKTYYVCISHAYGPART
jgi:hypothetical protein